MVELFHSNNTHWVELLGVISRLSDYIKNSITHKKRRFDSKQGWKKHWLLSTDQNLLDNY